MILKRLAARAAAALSGTGPTPGSHEYVVMGAFPDVAIIPMGGSHSCDTGPGAGTVAVQHDVPSG